MPKRVLTGRVKSDKMDKTRVVQIARLVRHPKYGKIYRDRTTCYVHDENNESKEGDTVEIIESAPVSKKKRWSLVSVCLLYTSPSPRDATLSRMPSSA